MVILGGWVFLMSKAPLYAPELPSLSETLPFSILLYPYLSCPTLPMNLHCLKLHWGAGGRAAKLSSETIPKTGSISNTKPIPKTEPIPNTDPIPNAEPILNSAPIPN